MSHDCYSSDTIGAMSDKLKESEEYCNLLKERLEEKDSTIREFQQQIELLKGLKNEYMNKYFNLKNQIESRIRQMKGFTEYRGGDTDGLEELQQLLKGD